MSCIPLPEVSLPTLPGGFSILPPTLPTLSFDAALCCKIPPVSIPLPPIPGLALILTPALNAIIKPYLTAINTFINSLPLDCPLE